MRSIAALFLVTSAVAAQTAFAPAGHALNEGVSNNTIPWWNQSNTYQQIHDANDIANAFGSGTALLTSMSFRKDAMLSSGLTGRTMDAQISIGTTAVPPSQITNTFATNIGPTPTVVLPYTNINLPSLTNTGIPNPAGWVFPFTTPYTYVSALGHLCWEIRHMNSISTTAPCDAWSPTSTLVYPNPGLGCVATGQTLPAQIATRSLSMTTGVYRNVLTRAAATTPAVMFVGVAPLQITLPGLCSSLEFVPVADVSGGTDGVGTWDLSVTFGTLTGMGAATIYAQFAFIDVGLPLSLGLSNATQISTPPGNLGLCARVWAASINVGPGFETALTGSVGTNYGLVTIFN